MNILEKIKENNLIGRGGAGFPTYLKWECVSQCKSKEKYLIVNGAEGEPGVYKDGYILKNYLSDFVLGVKVAANFIKAKKIYFYLYSEYANLHKKNIKKEFDKIGLKGKYEIILKPQGVGYVGGEESTILNIIEGNIAEPRIRPPFPTECGLFNNPTLVHNIETLYNISLVSQNRYKHERFYSINFAYDHRGVYSFSEDLSLEQILRQSGNYPDYDFFVQVGGDASGEVFNQKQLKKKACGAASITVYNLKKHEPEMLVNYWLSFFKNSSCGQCVPCREGTYRLHEMFHREKMEFSENKNFPNLIQNFATSFCALGVCAPIALTTYLKNVYPLIKIKN